jgi:hypothetical protein
MYDLNFYAELERRRDEMAELNREVEAAALLQDPAGHRSLLFRLGRQLSSVGERLQSRYGKHSKRPRIHVSEVSYRFN